MSTQIAESTTYVIDSAHGAIEFNIRHLMITRVRGRFAGVWGTAELGSNSDVPSSVRARIEAVDNYPVTREVALNAELGGRVQDPWGGQLVGYRASTTIDRKDFGLSWNTALEAGGVLVGDDVRIELDVQAVLEKVGDL